MGAQGNGITYSNMNAMREAFEAAGIEGIDFTTSPNRSYSNGVFASQFIGLAQLQEDKEGNKTLKGTSGMEQALDRILAGQNGIVTYEKAEMVMLCLGRKGLCTGRGRQGRLYNAVG